ncbi:CLUMA_CG013273, isoform A [Clunio marinus]|uniref:CLUMA_CG013273, isoform A n=1 Tax=Clunio marinus TaxID=568069 RepID=A0A1J1IID0_9DIPT|nr:CLUMA_CG013273, isoform A [Clunio marinus]
MAFKLFVVLSALFAVSLAVISGDYGSVGVQTGQDIRGPLSTLSSYQKSINTGNSQSFVSRTDYTSNPGLIAHPIAPVIAHAPVAAYAAPAYHAPIAAAPVFHGAAYPYAGFKAPIAAAAYYH